MADLAKLEITTATPYDPAPQQDQVLPTVIPGPSSQKSITREISKEFVAAASGMRLEANFMLGCRPDILQAFALANW